MSAFEFDRLIEKGSQKASQLSRNVTKLTSENLKMGGGNEFDQGMAGGGQGDVAMTFGDTVIGSKNKVRMGICSS